MSKWLPALSFASVEHFIQSLSRLLILLLINLLSYFLVPLSVLALGYAEVLRVREGVSMFDPARSGLLSAVLVAVYLVLHTVRASLIYHQFGSMDTPKYSLRSAAGEVFYFIGVGKVLRWGKAWQPRYKSSTERLERSAWWVGAVIVLLGTVGSMHTRLGVTVAGVPAMLSTLTIAEIMAYVGGFLLTVALLKALEWVIPYAYTLHASAQDSNVDPRFDVPDGTPLYQEQSIEVVNYPKVSRPNLP